MSNEADLSYSEKIIYLSFYFEIHAEQNTNLHFLSLIHFLILCLIDGSTFLQELWD